MWFCGEALSLRQHYLNGRLYVAALTSHRDVKAFPLENFIEEEDPDNRHIDMLFDFATA
jgi:hypothetical protein